MDDDMTYRRQIKESPDICTQMREFAERGIDFTFIEVESSRTAKMANIICSNFGNLSNAGMAAFFVTRECNAVCRALRLVPVKRRKSGSKLVANSKIDEMTESKGANKSMTCSCPLCGGITTVLHSYFIEAHREGREVYCGPCLAKKDKYEPQECCVCNGELTFSPYRYAMNGIEPKAKAAKRSKRSETKLKGPTLCMQRQ